MNNWQMSLDATQTALHSQGSALTENAKYMDSLAARIARMKSSWQELSIVMGETTITNSLIGLIGLATSLGHQFSWLVGKVGLFPPVTTAATIALYLLSSAFRGLTLSIATSIAGLFGVVPATVAATTGVVGLTGAVRTLGITWKGFLASTGVGLAIGIGLEVLVSLFGNATKASDDFEGSLSKLSDTVAQVSRLTELQKEYSALAKKVDLTTQEKIKLSQIESELQTKYSVSIGTLDSEHSAYLQNNNAIKQRIELLKEEIKTEREKASLDYRKQESKIDGDIARGKREADEAKRSYESLNYEYGIFKNNVKNGGIIEKRLSDTVGSYLPKIDASKSDGVTTSALKFLKETFSKDIDLARTTWKTKNIELQKAINVAQLGLKSEFSNYVDEIKAQGVEIKSTTGILFDALASISAENNLKFSDSQIASFFKLFNSANIQNVDDAATLFKKLPPDLQLTGVELSALNNALMKMAFGAVTDDMGEMADGLSDISEESSTLTNLIKDNIKEIKTLNQAINDVSEGQSLNGEAVADLIVQYPVLAKHILKTADGWIIEKDALEEVRKAKIQKAIDDLENEKKSSMATIDNSTARIMAYQTELLAIKEASDAKAKFETGISDFVKNNTKKVDFKSNTFDPFSNPADIFNKKTIVATDNGESELEKKIKQEEERLKSSSEKMSAYAEQIDALKKVISDPNFGVTGGTSSKTEKDQATFRDLTKERIAAINHEAESQKDLNKQTADRAKAWEDEKNYGKAVEETTNLLNGQKKEVTLLAKANKDLTSEVSTFKKNHSKYNMSYWLDGTGEATESFGKFLNSLKSKKEQDDVQKLFDKIQLLSKAKMDNSSYLEDLRTDIKKTIKIIDDDKLSGTKQYLDKQTKALEKYDAQLTHSEKVQKLFKDGTKEYNTELEIQSNILSDKEKFLKNEISWTEKRLKQGNLTKDQIKELNDYLEKNKELLIDVSIAQKTMADAWSSSVTSAAKDAMSALEDYYKTQGDLAEKALDRELNAYKEFIDAKRKLLNRSNSEEDFNADRSKLQNEAQVLQGKINDISRDTSTKGNFDRLQLEKELQSKLDEIAKLELDRSRTLRNDNLDDMEKAKEDEIKTAKDAADKKWQVDLQADKTYSALKEALLQNNVDKMQSILQIFATRIKGLMDEIGSSIDLNLIDKMKMNDTFTALSTTITSLPNNPSNANASSNTSAPSPTSNFTSAELSTIEKMKKNGELWKTDVANRAKYVADNEALGKSIGATFNSAQGAWYKNGIRLYHQGGEVGVNGTSTDNWFKKLLSSNEVPAILKKGEVVLDSPLKFINNIASRMMSGISNINPSLASAGTNDSRTYVTIENLSVSGGQAGAEKFFDAVERGKKTRSHN